LSGMYKYCRMIINRAEEFNKSATYYKIIGYNQGNYPYKLGLNTLADNGETFDKALICGSGGLYFCNIENIFEYLDYGNKVCTLTIPDDAQVIGVYDKYKADQIYINEIMELNYDTIKFLAERGADVTIGDNYAIRYSAQKGHLEIVKYLIKHGADVTAFNNYAICCAAPNGHLEIVKYLIEHGADVAARHNHAIRGASENGYLELVKYLFEHGADITAMDNYAICLAARNGHLEVVKYLIEHGADATADNNYAIRLAALNDHSEVVKYLAESFV